MAIGVQGEAWGPVYEQLLSRGHDGGQSAMTGGSVVLKVLFEAQNKFGRLGRHNRDQVARWVQKRVNELTHGEQPAAPAFDPKQAALPDGDK